MAPRDDDMAMDGLLRRSLLRDAAVGDCPAPDILAAYQEGSLEGEELARHELHFSGCARCREQLAAMARAGAEIEIPAYAAKVAALQASAASATPDSREERSRLRKRIWLLDWRFLAPVAAVLAFTVILYTQLMRHAEKPAALSNQVAMSRQEPLPPAATTREAPTAPPAATPSASTPPPSVHGAPAASQGADEGNKSLFAKKAGAPPRSLSREEKETRQALVKRLEEQRLSTSLEKPPEGATGDTQAEVDRFVARGGNAGARAQNAVAAAPPPNPPAQVAEQKSDGKVGAVTQSVTVQSQDAPIQPTPRSAKTMEAAPAKPKTTLPMNGRAMMDAATISARETLIKSPGDAAIYRIAEGGFIERSTDHGATWQGQQLDPNAEITAGAAPAAKICWLVGRDAAIYLTKDGNNWQRISPPARVDFVAVTATGASAATVTSSDGQKFSTRDGGKTWTLLQ